MDNLLRNILGLALDAAPWLLLGLLLAGLIRALLPADLARRWLGGSGLWPVTKAALVGAPIPICSCGVVPTALSLRRSGASKGSTLSFLIATPETGVDSVAVTYALMGPFMAIVRPIASILTAIGVGMSVGAVERREAADSPAATAATHCCHKESAAESAGSDSPGLLEGMRYAFTDLYDNIVVWLVFGLVIAGVVVTFVPPSLLAEAGSGIPAKVVMFLAGIPMYICATASTPLAASFLLAGISPGTVLVFLLAGPATNLGTIGIVRREFGGAVAATYLAGLAAFSIAAGIAADGLAGVLSIDIAAQLAGGRHLFPHWMQMAAALVLVIAAIPRLRRPVFDSLGRFRGQHTSA